MSRLEVDESRIREVVLVREDRACPECRARMHVRFRGLRNIHTLNGPVRLTVKLVQCRNKACDSRTTFPPEQEAEGRAAVHVIAIAVEAKAQGTRLLHPTGVDDLPCVPLTAGVGFSFMEQPLAYEAFLRHSHGGRYGHQQTDNHTLYPTQTLPFHEQETLSLECWNLF